MKLIRYLFENKKTIVLLVKNDLQKKVVGSFLGKIWLFFNPIVSILLMWFVFSIGFKTPDIKGVPFIVWISCGMIVWLFFSEAIITMVTSLREYDFMIKQITFRAEIIPLIKLFSSAVIFICMNILLCILGLIYNCALDIYLLQIIYYFICICYLLVGVGWLLSSMQVFIKDIFEMTSTFLQLFFWYTPIIWNSEIIKNNYKLIFKLNPLYYIIQGYRDIFIYKIWFWNRKEETLIFYLISTTIFLLGYKIFTKLKKQFNDVL